MTKAPTWATERRQRTNRRFTKGTETSTAPQRTARATTTCEIWQRATRSAVRAVSSQLVGGIVSGLGTRAPGVIITPCRKVSRGGSGGTKLQATPGPIHRLHFARSARASSPARHQATPTRTASTAPVPLGCRASAPTTSTISPPETVTCTASMVLPVEPARPSPVTGHGTTAAAVAEEVAAAAGGYESGRAGGGLVGTAGQVQMQAQVRAGTLGMRVPWSLRRRRWLANESASRTVMTRVGTVWTVLYFQERAGRQVIRRIRDKHPAFRKGCESSGFRYTGCTIFVLFSVHQDVFCGRPLLEVICVRCSSRSVFCLHSFSGIKNTTTELRGYRIGVDVTTFQSHHPSHNR
jgi:hypothetical protein